jgi:Ca2+-binding RTX toxin-like protein
MVENYADHPAFWGPLTFGGFGDDVISGGSENDLIFGFAGDDEIAGGAGNDTVLGGEGDDTVDGNSGHDQLAGGEGDDLQRGGNGSDFILGDAGDDTLLGNGDDDRILGGDGIDVLRGGTGNDTLIGGRGDDFAGGGSGDDLIIWNNGDGSDLFNGGDGFDQVQVNGANAAGDDFEISESSEGVAFQRNNLGLFALDIRQVELLDINGRGGDDTISAAGFAANVVELDLDGGAGDDFLSGSDGRDTLRGGDGDDTLVGNRGDDSATGGEGNDLFIWNNGDGSDLFQGNAGEDEVQVNGADAAGDDFEISESTTGVMFQRNNLGLFALDIQEVETLDINGQGGNDTISAAGLAADIVNLDLAGGAGDDLLIGSDGVDTLRGGGGDDTMIGNRGDDVAFGQGGDDLFIWNNGDGSDRFDGGVGDDEVQVNGADAAGDDFEISESTTGVTFQRNNLGLFSLDIRDVESLDINGQGGDDTISAAGLAADVVTLDLDGGFGDDFLSGSDARDTLRGSGGDDTLVGNRGDDFIAGGNGDDLLIWNNGDGSDLMVGGQNDDRVQVNGADEAGDSFEISESATGVTFNRVNLGLFSLDIRDVETLEVNGQGGDDTISAAGLPGDAIKLELNGGDGDDILIGGDGDDILNGGSGSDTITGGDGSDSVVFDGDPFKGADVSSPGRQIVGGEDFIEDFDFAEDQYLIDGADFGVTDLTFASVDANAPGATVPTDANVIVLLNSDDDRALPFGAGTAADQIADLVTDDGAGFFVYSNSFLGVNRLVYSENLNDEDADLSILARQVDLVGQDAIDALSAFSADNFDLI